MAIIQLSWEVVDLATLLANGFDQQKIEVENPPATWTEITRTHSRLPLVEDVERYLFETPSDITYGFRAVPYRSVDMVEDTPISITDTQVRGYCTIQDIRDEGYNDPPYTDTRVQSSINKATTTIDRICGQRFDPYFAQVRLNVKKQYDEHHLDVPIAALWKIQDDDDSLTLSDILVYNRHLTEGLENPDDRKNPMIAWGEDRSTETDVFTGGKFLRGRKTLRLWGVFGFTEIGEGDQVGETALDSQIPLSYGSTPAEIKTACMMLVTDYLPTLASGGNQSALSSRILSEKTRDQEYKLQSLSTNETSFGLTGNNEVDSILMRYGAPARIGAV